MDTQNFIDQLKDWSNRYKDWWFEPYNNFRKNYSQEHPNMFREPQGLENYQKAYNEFETQLRRQNDLVEELYQFIDLNYDVYLNATPDQHAQIRTTINRIYHVSNNATVTYFLEDLLLRYVREWVNPNLQKTGETIWLTRGLVAMSLENIGVDYRDSISCLYNLYAAAKDGGLDPETHFQEIAQISDTETPRGGPICMQNVISNIGPSLKSQAIESKTDSPEKQNSLNRFKSLFTKKK